MPYQSDIFAALNGDSALTAIIGGRIYADVADAKAVAPYVVFQTITTGGENAHNGERRLCFPLVQFSCWAKTKGAAVELGAAVAAILDGQTVNGNSDCSFQFANQSSNYDTETRLFGEVLEYNCAALTN